MAYKGSLVELLLFGTYCGSTNMFTMWAITLDSNHECHVHLPFG